MGVKESDVRSHYLTARKMGVKEYSRNISKGRSGYLPFLEGVLKNIEIIYEADLGIVDIPLKKIVGTYTYARSRSFAANFMPLLKSGYRIISSIKKEANLIILNTGSAGSARQQKVRKHHHAEDNPIIAERLEIVLFDVSH